MMVVVALFAILQSMAVPAFTNFMDSMRLNTSVNSLFSSLTLARSEAIKRNSRAVVCKSAMGDACNATGGWEQGWIVFHDANNNALRDNGEAILFRQEALSKSIRLFGNGPVSKYVSYTPTGATNYASGAFQAGTFTVCKASATNGEARELKISITGRPRTTKRKVENCFI
jgi:type IV fimbrial biogenesis protein FimT